MADIYVSPTGDDVTGDGSIGNPYATIAHAYSTFVSGDIIWLLPGTHTVSAPISISIANPIHVEGYDPDLRNTIIALTANNMTSTGTWPVQTWKNFHLKYSGTPTAYTGMWGNVEGGSHFSRIYIEILSTTTKAIAWYEVRGTSVWYNITGRQTGSGTLFEYFWSNNANTSDIRNCIFDKASSATTLGQNVSGDTYNCYPGASLPNCINYTTYGASGIFASAASGAELLDSGPCVNAGTVLSPVTDGYVGAAPDMGALEYGAAYGGGGGGGGLILGTYLRRRRR